MRLPTLGEVALHTFLLSLVSGIILLFRYDVSQPYRSVLLIDSVYSYGSFIRNLHYYTAFFAVLFVALHSWKYFLEKYEIKVDSNYWLIALVLFYVVIFTSFSGYVIRFDREGFFAGRIASQVIETLPLFGNSLSKFIFSPDTPITFFVFHIIILPFLFFLLIGSHINWKRFIDADKFIISNIVPFILSALIKAPLPPYHDILADPIKGPWFFVGMQELVYLTPPLIGGIILPFLYFLLWLSFPFLGNGKKEYVKYLLIILTIIYILLSLLALYFRGPGWKFRLPL